jgi:hypothetical protein
MKTEPKYNWIEKRISSMSLHSFGRLITTFIAIVDEIKLKF